MNKPNLVNISGPFEAEALRILRGIPGLEVTAEPVGQDRGIDFLVTFADKRMPVVVEVKSNANPATAWQLVHDAQTHPDKHLLLIADRTTAEARAILEEHGVAVLDGIGNAHIELPGLLFHLEGRGRPHRLPTTSPRTRLSGKAGVVVQALLLHPNRAWHVKDLAVEAKVSAALVHRVFKRLENEGLLITDGAGPTRVRRVARPSALLDLWAEETNERETRIPAHLLARTPQLLVKELGSRLGQRGVDYALTGACAAAIMAPFITAVPVAEVWVRAAAAHEELYEAAQVEPVTSGENVVFLQTKGDTPLAFREQRDELWLANRFRLYADLRRDPRRGREQAENLRQEVIGF